MNTLFLDRNAKYFFEVMEHTSYQKDSMHYHDLFEIFYLTEGDCRYFIDSKSYPIKVGDVVFIPPRLLHKSNYDTALHSRILINCSEQLLPKSVIENIDFNSIIIYSESAEGEMNRLFNRLKRENDRPDTFSKDSVKSLLAEIFIILCRHSTAKKIDKSEMSCTELAVSYVQENYTSKITLTDTAKYCSVSSEHLSRSFKKHTGVSFNEYVTIYRLTKAEDMLLHNRYMSVADVAYSCGFNDSNYFSSVFHKHYGISPMRKKHQNN